MVTLPAPLTDYICNYIAEQHFPAYLKVEADGTVMELGGQLQHYELQMLRPGDTAHSTLDFLAGLIPLESGPLFLPLVKYQQGRSMDVHIIPAGDGDWILLLDGSAAEEQQLALQQQGNYLALKTQRQKQHLSPLFQGPPDSCSATETSRASSLVDVAILNITIHPLMDTARVAAPMATIQAIEAYFAAVATIIVDQSGVVTAQIGRTILAIFGLMPMPLPPAQQAVETGLDILRSGSLPALAHQPSSEFPVRFEAGAMVTSGASALGLLRASPYQSMGLISPQMPQIVSLTGHIRPNELMIDTQTFSRMTCHQETFAQSELSFKDSSSMTIYSCRP